MTGIEGTRHGSGRDPRELAGAWVRHQSIDFPEPAPDLAPFVERYWAVEWDYATPYRQKIVPMPNVQVTMVPGGVPEVHGVCTGFQVKVLSGAGRVVGAAVRPGAFRAFLDGPVAALTDRTVRADSLPALAGAPEEPVTTGTLRGVAAPPPPRARTRQRRAGGRRGGGADRRRPGDRPGRPARHGHRQQRAPAAAAVRRARRRGPEVGDPPLPAARGDRADGRRRAGGVGRGRRRPRLRRPGPPRPRLHRAVRRAAHPLRPPLPGAAPGAAPGGGRVSRSSSRM